LPDGLKIGSVIKYRADTKLKNKKNINFLHKGDSCLIGSMPLSVNLHNIEFKPGDGGKLARAAGTSAKIVRKFNLDLKTKVGFIGLKLPSGKFKYLLDKCLATFGRVSNISEKLIKILKAGTNSRMGNRPKVRGVAMNPVDHPHGGGEGKTSGGRISVSKWGFLTKGFCTKKYKKKKKDIRIYKRINKLN